MKGPITLMSAAAILAALGLAAPDTAAQRIPVPTSPGKATAGAMAPRMAETHMRDEGHMSRGGPSGMGGTMPMMDRNMQRSGPSAQEHGRGQMERMQKHMEDMQDHMNSMHGRMMEDMQKGMMEGHEELGGPDSARWQAHMEDMQQHMNDMHERMMKAMRESMMEGHSEAGTPDGAGRQEPGSPTHGHRGME